MPFPAELQAAYNPGSQALGAPGVNPMMGMGMQMPPPPPWQPPAYMGGGGYFTGGMGQGGLPIPLPWLMLLTSAQMGQSQAGPTNQAGSPSAAAATGAGPGLAQAAGLPAPAQNNPMPGMQLPMPPGGPSFNMAQQKRPESIMDVVRGLMGSMPGKMNAPFASISGMNRGMA